LALALAVLILTLIAFYVHIVRSDTVLRLAKAEGKKKDIAERKLSSGSASKEPPVNADAFPGESRFVRWLRRVFISLFGILVFWFMPALCFFVAMIVDGEKDAAVFAMAIAAIYVAAEHYSTLEGQKAAAEAQQRDLQDVAGQLKENVTSIANALGKTNALAEMYKVYRQLPGEIDAVDKNDARDGLDKGGAVPAAAESTRSAISADRCIYAIYREFDIEHAWWSAPNWASYCAQKGDETLSLYRALVDGQRYAALIVVPFSFRARSEMGDKEGKIQRFQDIIGLMWTCVLLWHVGCALRKDEGNEDDDQVEGPKKGKVKEENEQIRTRKEDIVVNHRIIMAETSLWVHVVNGEVHQILDQPRNEVAVRNLSLNVGTRGVPLAEWARAEICRLATRGPTAHEYLCSCLCRANPSLLHDLNLDPGYCEAVLKKIAFEDWLDTCVASERAQRKDRCIELLRDFMQILEMRQTGGNRDSLQPNYTGNSRFMVKEVQ
jgi:hypothetical protein